jgi:hypothetical protein
MKKTYINPEMEIIEIKMQQMLAASTLGINEEEVGGGSALGREFGDEFGDEFDYEFGE